MKTILYFFSCLFMAVGFAQNIVISNQNSPNEPSIMVDPKNPNRLIAASNINNYYLSSDAGSTWTEHTLSSSYGVWGDPVLDVDTNGNFYFFHLSNPADGNWIDRIVCQKTTDHGVNWNNGSFTGLDGTKAQDKQWSIIDRTNNNIYLTWTQFDDYGSTNPMDSSLILFSKSTDLGETWSTPLRINQVAGNCIDEDDTVEGATPAIGPNGEIYAVWTGPAGIVFDKSLDGGLTWMENDILIDSMTAGWEYDIPGINRANGLPILKCDLSGGPNHGHLYVNWSDQRNGINNTDIWMSKSTDGGNTWSAATKVNSDNSHKHQFFTWMDIDQTNGDLAFIFYDRRHYSNNQTDVYIAISKDGGLTFDNKRISESPFTPVEGIFFGDYTNIVFNNGVIHPIWTRLNQGVLSILTDITPLDEILNQGEYIYESNELTQYPNPASNFSYTSFKLHKTSLVNLEIIDQNGQKIKTILHQKSFDYGKHIIPIDLSKLNLPKGIYFKRLSIGEKIKTLKFIVN